VFDIAVPTLGVIDSAERFPVRRIYCVGRNYADHAREMQANPETEPPFFFMKPADAAFTVLEDGSDRAAGTVPFPTETADFQHEVELVVAIGTGGTNIAEAASLDHVWGYAVGIDLTRRDLQAEAKALRRPWDLSKGFDFSAPVSPLVPVAASSHPDRGTIWLKVDGQVRQTGDLASQLWNVPGIIAELSRFVTLFPGDLVMTGTPAGVSALDRGDVVTAGIDGVGELEFVVV